MIIKELIQNLNNFDSNDKVHFNGNKLTIYEKNKDWYSYIRFEELEELENNEQLTHKEKIKYLQMALAMVYNFRTFDLKTVDMIVSLSDLINEKKENTCLQSICEVIKEVQNRFENKTAR